jgi:hypothetical protein
VAYGEDSLVCTNCWYGRDSLTGRWEFSSEDTNDFFHPLSHSIMCFPLPMQEARKSRVVYGQVIASEEVVDQVALWVILDKEYETAIKEYARREGIVVTLDDSTNAAVYLLARTIKGTSRDGPAGSKEKSLPPPLSPVQ